MWLVCYDIYGKTSFNTFEKKDDAIACFHQDKSYYLENEGQGNFKIFIAEVKDKY